MKPGDKIWLHAGQNKWIRAVILYDHGNSFWIKIIHPAHPQHGSKLNVKAGELKIRIPPGGVPYRLTEPMQTLGCPQCGALSPTWQYDNKKCDGCGFEKFKEWLERNGHCKN